MLVIPPPPPKTFDGAHKLFAIHPSTVYRPIWATYSQNGDQNLLDLNAKWRSEGLLPFFPIPWLYFYFSGKLLKKVGDRSRCGREWGDNVRRVGSISFRDIVG
ncbi:hypothetical protein NPIL_593091 [Nephila pilipes]|uniref:Uncharacterized protein n=1 Tax=Nephila pilipes TaxID=299642 RepID=A0A8X6MRQ7_NEPPI|nr:hypothetical protein NPIL_593091 [Nephila pilipes]